MAVGARLAHRLPLDALELTGREASRARMVINGAGSAGIACAELIKAMGVPHDNVLLCDTGGVRSRVPLVSLVAASNEVPETAELRAQRVRASAKLEAGGYDDEEREALRMEVKRLAKEVKQSARRALAAWTKKRNARIRAAAADPKKAREFWPLCLKQVANAVLDRAAGFEAMSQTLEDHRIALEAFQKREKPRFVGR